MAKKPRLPGNSEYERLAGNTLDRLQGLNARLASGRIDADRWQDDFHAILFDGHTDAWVQGRQRAGVEGPRGEDDERFGLDAADGQDSFLSGFAQAMRERDARYFDEDGNLRMDRVRDRAALYVARMRGTANEAFVEASEDDDEFDWVLGPKEHCDDCLELAALGPYTKSTMISHPGDGQTECLGNCGCRLVRRRDDMEGFERAEIYRRLESSVDGGEYEYDLQPIVETTKDPRLPVLLDGADHLDVDPDTTPAQLRDIIRLFDREVLAVFDPETKQLTHAPIVGEGASVAYDRFEDLLRGKLVVHNHPTGKLFSPADVATCYALDLAEIQATMPGGGYISLAPTGGRWKSRTEVLDAISKAARAWVAWIDDEMDAGRKPTPRDLRIKYNDLAREALRGKPVRFKRHREET